MQPPTKIKLVYATGSAVLVGYSAAWLWAALAGSYPVMLALLRAGLITLALMWVAIGVWWIRRAKTFTVRSLVFGGPLMVAVAAVPLPYYSQGRSVQLSLQKAGLQYRVQAHGFARTLQQISCELFGLDSPNLFAAQLTFLSVDLATAQQDQLLELGNHSELQVVAINKSDLDQQLTPSLIQWINSLPMQTRVTMTIYELSQPDAEQLESIERRLHEINVYGKMSSTRNIMDVIECQPENAYFSGVVFPADFGQQSAVSSSAASALEVPNVRLNRCQLTGAQLVHLAKVSGCTSLNCDYLTTNLSVDDCRQLAALPRLKSLLLGTMTLGFDELQPLMASPQLSSFMAAAMRGVSQAELEILRESIPVGCNRRLRVDQGWGIAVGDVGVGRRGY